MSCRHLTAPCSARALGQARPAMALACIHLVYKCYVTSTRNENGIGLFLPSVVKILGMRLNGVVTYISPTEASICNRYQES